MYLDNINLTAMPKISRNVSRHSPVTRQYFHCIGDHCRRRRSLFANVEKKLQWQAASTGWSLSKLAALDSWCCVLRRRQFKTPDDWRDITQDSLSLQYQLVDVQRFCHLIRLYSFWSHPSFSAYHWPLTGNGWNVFVTSFEFLPK